jgi:hypothetical protein
MNDNWNRYIESHGDSYYLPHILQDEEIYAKTACMIMVYMLEYETYNALNFICNIISASKRNSNLKKFADKAKKIFIDRYNEFNEYSIRYRTPGYSEGLQKLREEIIGDNF